MNQTTLNYRYTLGVSSLLLVSLTPLQAQALTVEEVPNPQQNNDGWVTDMAEILNDKTEDKLNTLISQLEAENGTEIAVVTVPQTSPSATPKDFTTELFNHWGIGKAESDNGILFLVSTGDRRVEIETGYGIEPILPDAKVGNIIDTKITPQFKQGNYDDGTIAGTQALVDALQNQTSTTSSTESNQSDNFFGSLPFFGLIAILAVVTGLLFKRKRHSSTDKSYTSSDYDSNNLNNNNLNSDRSDKDKSSTYQTIANSKKSVGDRHSKSDRSSGINNSSSSKNHRRSSRYSGSSYIDGSSYGGGGTSSSGSSSGGSSSGGGTSSSGSSSGSGYSGGSSGSSSSGGGYSGGGSSGGSSSSGSSGGGGAGGGF